MMRELDGSDIGLLRTKQKQQPRPATSMWIDQFLLARQLLRNTPTQQLAWPSASKLLFCPHVIAVSWYAPCDLQSHGRAVRYEKRKSFNWRFLSDYFPVIRQDNPGTELSQLPVGWIRNPIICIGTNGKVGRIRAGGYLIQGDGYWEWHDLGLVERRSNMKMAPASTVCSKSSSYKQSNMATFWSHEDYGSRITHICAPKGS